MVLSSRKQSNVDRAMAELQAQNLSISGTMCHVGQAEDREHLVAMALGPYSVSKTALLGLTKALAPKLGACNIRINGLAPGLIRTKFGSIMNLWKDEDVRKKMMELLRMQRLQLPSVCAGVVSFLCSPNASYITGETVAVGGGAPSRL